MRPCGKPGTWYLNYQSTYGHQTWQNGKLPWWAPNNKVMTLWSHELPRSHENLHMATKLGSMVTYLEGNLTIKLYYALITWSCKVTWQTKIIISPLPECLWLTTRRDNNLLRWAPTYKVTWPFDYMVLWDHVTNLKSLYLKWDSVCGNQAS